MSAKDDSKKDEHAADEAEERDESDAEAKAERDESDDGDDESSDDESSDDESDDGDDESSDDESSDDESDDEGEEEDDAEEKRAAPSEPPASAPKAKAQSVHPPAKEKHHEPAHGGGHAEHHGDMFYVQIWAVLVVLLVVSVVGPMLGHPILTLITAFGIAIVKAYMVAKNFMHLAIERRYVVYMLVTMVAFMGLFFAGTSPDVMKHKGHNWKNEAAEKEVKRALEAAKHDPHKAH